MKKKLAIALAALLCAVFAGGCKDAAHELDPHKPVTLTMWHNFGGDMQKSMDFLIDEFNGTVGSEKGIIINVTAITSSAELQETLSMIVNDDPGAPEMPDITTAYPKTAIKFQSKAMIADLDRYFSAEELAAYVPSFIEEGRFGDGGLYVFPFAKSTEILYLNQTLFDRFAAATGVTMDCFASLEGIAEAARQYYAWTKENAANGEGKCFFTADSWLNLVQTGMEQLDASLFKDGEIVTSDPALARITDICRRASSEGGFAIYDGYSSDLSKTGDLVCSTGSSAGILFYGDTITYADNTVEKVEYSILPYPVLEGGKKIAIQRGGGFMVSAADETRAYAASIFLKWFTQSAQNMRFVASTGYLPVTNEAFEVDMPKEIEKIDDVRIQKMLKAVMQMHQQYDFFVPPAFEGFDEKSKSFEKEYKTMLAAAGENARRGG